LIDHFHDISEIERFQAATLDDTSVNQSGTQTSPCAQHAAPLKSGEASAFPAAHAGA
jgi:hypothetical protein